MGSLGTGGLRFTSVSWCNVFRSPGANSAPSWVRGRPTAPASPLVLLSTPDHRFDVVVTDGWTRALSSQTALFPQRVIPFAPRELLKPLHQFPPSASWRSAQQETWKQHQQLPSSLLTYHFPAWWTCSRLLQRKFKKTFRNGPNRNLGRSSSLHLATQTSF